MKLILLILLGIVFTLDSTNILLREIETYEEDNFSYVTNNEIKKYYDRNINVFVSILEDYDNWISIDNVTQYQEIYSDLFGLNKTFYKRKVLK